MCTQQPASHPTALHAPSCAVVVRAKPTTVSPRGLRLWAEGRSFPYRTVQCRRRETNPALNWPSGRSDYWMGFCPGKPNILFSLYWLLRCNRRSCRLSRPLRLKVPDSVFSGVHEWVPYLSGQDNILASSHRGIGWRHPFSFMLVSASVLIVESIRKPSCSRISLLERSFPTKNQQYRLHCCDVLRADKPTIERGRQTD